MRARRSLLCLLATVVVMATAPAGAAPVCVPGADVVDRCEAWEAVYDYAPAHAANGWDIAGDIASSPDGSRVFVTGRSWDATVSRLKTATVAFDVATGAQIWADRYEGEVPENDYLSSAVVSPDGSRVYVTGVEHMGTVGESGDFLTIAYDAATGQRLWVSNYDSPAPENQDEEAHAATVSPDGRWVYVTGETGIADENNDWATVAYNADTGEEAWSLDYSRVPGAGEDIGVSIVASNDVVYVGGEGGATIAALAIRAGDPRTDPEAGTLLWSRAERRGFGYWIALSPDGKRVYLSGSDQTPSNGTLTPDWDYATIALDASTGQELWMSTYASPDKGLDVPYAQALSPSGDRIYVTGRGQGAAGVFDGDYATVAYDTATGARLWVTRFSTPGTMFEIGADVEVSPDGTRVYVSGGSLAWADVGDAITQAYDAGTGAVVWSARNNSTPERGESAWRMVVAGSKLVVAGSTGSVVESNNPLGSQTGSNRSDYLVFAYNLP